MYTNEALELMRLQNNHNFASVNVVQINKLRANGVVYVFVMLIVVNKGYSVCE